MSFRNFAAAAIVAAVAGGTGCASGAGGMYLDDEPKDRRQTTLAVSNNNWSEMTIYVVRSGVQARIGRVPAMGARTFDIPPTLIGGAGEVSIVARPLASRYAFTSRRIMASPGQRIDLRLENNLNLSSFSVW